MSPEVYRRVAPYLSVVGDDRVNVNVAPLPVLMTLPGINPAAAAAMVRRRQTRPYRNAFEVSASLPRDAREMIQAEMDQFLDRVAFGPRDLEIVATAVVEGSPVGAQLWALVHLSGGAAWSVERVVER